MKTARIGAAIATVGVGALVLGGCATPDSGSGLDEGTSVSVAWNQAFYSSNGNTSFANATANNNINYLIYGTFNYYDNTPELVRDESFGSYELVSEDPLVVEYTLADDVVWSDGATIDAADLLLSWAALSQALDDDGFDPSQFQDPDTGEFTEDYPTDVVFFDTGTQLSLVTETPEVGDDGRSITMTFSEPFVDWELVFGTTGTILPAHVVAQHALGIEDADEAKQAVLDAILNDDREALAAISNAWNTIFNFTELPEDPSLLVSSGPYQISEFVADQYITLTANENYVGDRQPNIEEVTVRFIGDPLAAVTALENGEVDVISPQATTDVVAGLEAIDGVEIITGLEGTYEHVDLQITNSRNPGVFEDQRVREAFLKTIPRQQIVDTLIKPIIGDDALVRNSFVFVPGAEGYDDSVANNGSSAYDEVDIEGAQALLAEAGVTEPEVCLLYASNNPRRVNEFALIQESAALAGFNVTDCGSEQWGGLLGTAGAYDASLFGWQSTGLGVTDNGPTYQSTGINNLNFYSNAEVDELFNELYRTFEADQQIEILKEIDALLWADAYGTVLFQFPSVTGVSDRVTGVAPSIIAPTIFWNVWDWEIAE